MSTALYPWLEHVTVGDPSGEPTRALVSDGSGPFARVTPRISEILRAAKRRYPNIDESEIAELVGATPADVAGVLTHFGSLSRAQRAGTPTARLVFRSRFVVQFTLLDPTAVFRRAPWVARLAVSRRLSIATSVLVVLGGLAVMLSVMDPNSAAHRTLTLPQYLWVVVALFASTFAHEFAHGASLTGLGGRARRLGVMVFYFVPAFFCDVSEGWHLSRASRVRVALAGIRLQCALASIALLCSFELPSPVATPLALYGVLGYAYTLLNLIPLIRLDGYVALVGFLDRPNLRSDAIGALGGMLVGRSTARVASRRDPAWLPLFGLLCVLFPVAVVVAAAAAIDSFFSSWGRSGAAITLSVFAIAALLGLSVLAKAIRFIVRARRSPAHAAALVIALLAIVGAAILVVPVPSNATAAVIGTPSAARLAVAAATAEVVPGDSMALYPRGAIPGPRVAVARVASEPQRCSVPLSTVTPLSGSGLRVTAECYRVVLPPRAAVQLPAAAVLGSRSTAVEAVRFAIARLTGSSR